VSATSLRHVVVEGPVGVGKTSLARRLAESLGHGLMLEAAEENPFLERFYQDPRRGALPAQLYFLFQRARQLEALRQQDLFRPALIADFLMEKDRLFAELTLDDDEFRLYEQVYRQLALDAPVPDLVVYLQAPVEVLLRRVSRRGIPHEQLIESAYLQRVTDAYTSFFYHYDAAPLLIVNAAEIDLVNSEEDYHLLLDQVLGMRSGRHYFNPVPLAL
jgi:deoxyguanosine kinase